MSIFDDMESAVQSYARSFPVTFSKAKGCYLIDEQGKQYLDFLAGAGTLNYGHNHPELQKQLVDYVLSDGITHGLDMHTEAKAAFLQSFKDLILSPRGLNYRMQFTSPTGTNSVEAAMKLARKVKKRSNIIAFTNGFHGVSMGALTATGNKHHRQGAGVSLNDIARMPFDGYYGDKVDTLAMMDKLLSDPSSGIDRPAAVLVECIQGEGGLNVASDEWLQGIEALCQKYDMLLIVDDIQAGCGRSGDFFSFEPSGIKPDIVTLSKSISGMGLPLAVVLLKPELDLWQPGEHNGTFRGNNHAFVTATAALQLYWQDLSFSAEVKRKAQLLRNGLQDILDSINHPQLRLKGRGFMQGIECPDGAIADQVTEQAFNRGMVIETSGNVGQVVKCLCPLVISDEELAQGLAILKQSFTAVFDGKLSQAV